MATEIVQAPVSADGQGMTPADRLAHEAGSYVRTAPPAPKPTREILHRIPAGNPRGSWPAEEFAAQQRREGVAAEVVLDLPSDDFLVIVEVA
ncbi:hypothetical protein [Streptomyces sp. NRRL S-813]|uniref:hypothetical protein n=1 Tax=Streptomyces sp. NRRL S-813 TaxID=1463919 RepID=UPI00056B7AE6|nr:hypothetical protein [Streptomyces sp. NRRL S-813]